VELVRLPGLTPCGWTANVDGAADQAEDLFNGPEAGTMSASERRGTSIRIYLADGTPEGLRVLDKPNWTGVAIACSRAQYPQIRHREELNRAGIYVLIGDAEGPGAQATIYVGEAELLRKRLDQQQQAKDFWTRFVAFASKDGSLNKVHGLYLESRLVGLANSAKRAVVDNGNAPVPPQLSEPERADGDTFLDEMLVFFPLVGVSAFEMADASTTDARVLHLKGPDTIARGYDTPEGFRVLAGATGRIETVPSIHAYLIAKRDQMIEAGLLAPEAGVLRLTQDYAFDSPSQAAAVLLGRSANGRTEWTDENGRTLKSIQEGAVASEPT
jgi:Domain of unknown function (DUF4357)